MAAWAKHIQRAPVSKEYRPLRFSNDHLRSYSQICDTCFRKAVNDLIQHFAWVFNYVKNSSHVFAPFSLNETYYSNVPVHSDGIPSSQTLWAARL
jgi:hypothetical protein